jgi:hypothetical protein
MRKQMNHFSVSALRVLLAGLMTFQSIFTPLTYAFYQPEPIENLIENNSENIPNE